MKTEKYLCRSRWWSVIFPIFLLHLFFSPSWAVMEKEIRSAENRVYRPTQITSRTDAVMDMAVSADGQIIVYVSGEEKPTTLWLASADPGVVNYPEKMIDGPSIKSSPAISKTGRFIAYVDTDYDVKGDIYIIDRQNDKTKPVRLTGRETEDGGPSFSADNRFLYFHQATGNNPKRLVFLDLKKDGSRPTVVDTNGDAMFCTISPDNSKIAFVSTRKEASGDIYILNRQEGSVLQITAGPSIDMFPQWYEDSKTLYFSRIGSDTNHDGHLSTEDRSVIYRIQTDDVNGISYPVTPLNQFSFKPYTGAKRLYFLSSRGGVSNCWTLPEAGTIGIAETSRQQYRIAETIAKRIPYDPYQTLLAFIRVSEKFPEDTVTGAKAEYRAARTLQELGLLTTALNLYLHLQSKEQNVLPEAIFSEIRQLGIEFQLSIETLTGSSEKNSLLEKKIRRLDQIAQEYNGPIPAEARIESAAMIVQLDPGLSKMTDAVSRLKLVLTDTSADDSQKAQALFLQATIYEKTTAGNRTIDTLRKIIVDYPKERKWVDKAVDGIVDHILTHFAYENRDEKIRKLSLVAMQNQYKAPEVAMGALNRIGDLYYKNDEWSQAKTAYENVLDTYPVLTTQTAAARLSLAEILFQEEEFRKAIDLYEHEIGLRDSTDRIYQLAREGYIRKKISAGDFLFRLGEIPSARSLYKELMDYDDRITEAHRGYIRCAAASGDMDKVFAVYEAKLKAQHTDPVWLYCTGLCLTYRNDEGSTKKAQKRIERAIRLNGNIEYFYQTLGYVYEVLETVYGESGQLEHALIAYQKAFFLNDPDKNFENASNLELNLGNVYYLLGQYGKAFDFYTKRDQRKVEFSDPNTEILFYKRLGESAFQNNDITSAITGFQKAIDRIDVLVDPLAPSIAFDRLNRYLKDRILDPAINLKAIGKPAERIAEKQSAQNLIVASLSAKAFPPPSEQWLTYKQGMLRLMGDQKSINKQAAELANSYNSAIEDIPGGLRVKHAEPTLAGLTRQILSALDFPERLIEIKAETLDRLALAYQENADWKKAAETFKQVYLINEKNENVQNLARNRRSVAYTTYQLANSVTGEQRVLLLKKASDDFNEVLFLLDRYGVPEKSKKEKKGLVEISIATSLDETATTQAARGFSKAQEKRLAETFISRIALELGNPVLSRIELEKQLQAYPSPDSVKEKDLYGASLLFHRAGLLENGTGNIKKAFEYFAFSTQLCLKMENPVSAAINLTNMASTGQKLMALPDGAGLSLSQMESLVSLDKQTMGLLSKKLEIIGLKLPMQVHNQLGVFYFQAADQIDGSSPSVERTFQKIFLQQRAVAHFTRGIFLFEQKGYGYQRHDLETATRLYLNMAAAGRKLGEEPTAKLNDQKALKTSETGVFPDLQWRALAGLQKYEQALKVLESIPLSRTGCAPLEIVERLGPLVYAKFKEKQVEAALHLAEKLSELERFNRTALFARPESFEEKAFFSSLYPRLESIQALANEVAAADADHRQFVEQRLENEKSLLARQLGPDNYYLPEPYRNISDKNTRDLAMFLASLSEKIEQAADELAKIRIQLSYEANNNEKNIGLSVERFRTYQTLVRRYQNLATKAIDARPLNSTPDFITLMTAEPFDVMDLSEVLTDDDAVVRIFRFGEIDHHYLAFFITKEETTALAAINKEELKKKIDETIDWVTPYIAFERPGALNFGSVYPYALSAKHLERSINNRKPFKRKLAVIPELSFPEATLKGYALQNKRFDEKMNGDDLYRVLHGVNTLVLTNGPVATTSVPTKPGNRAGNTLTVSLDSGAQIRLDRLLSETSNLSLAIVKGGHLNPLYLTGHLFSIYGCPSTIFMESFALQPSLLPEFFTSYVRLSGFDALISSKNNFKSEVNINGSPVEGDTKTTSPFLYLGYRGMSEKNAGRFAKKNFVHYVKAGRSDFNLKKYAAAKINFENAIAVANEVSKFDRYLPDLLNYARESAYRSGDMEAALFFASDLAGLMTDANPGTKAEAKALLRLGLLYAKEQNYEKAIPIIESAVSIMSGLEPDEDLARAVVDLGIVLENATNHETALSRFKNAVKISRDLNFTALLAEQYLHIGRVYDLRLNQYATAIFNYEKALKIYSLMEDIEKIAESKLNIGRCYRLLGNFTKADSYFEQSSNLLDESTTQRQMINAKILIEQANNAWFQGSYEKAFRLQRQCYDRAEKNNFALLQVISLNTEGLIWWTLGDYKKSLTALENALSHAKLLNIRTDEIASTLNNIGLVYRDKGDYQKAIDFFNQAIEIDTAIDSKWGLAYDFRNKGLTYLQQDQPEKAWDLFKRAYEISTAIGNRINAAKAILGMGDALFALNDFQQAENAYGTALNLSESMMIRETQWRALFGLARVQMSYYNNFDEAEKRLRASIDVIEQLRSDIKVKQLKENFLADKLTVYETLVTLLADNHQPVHAFEIAERSRARNFIDLLGGAKITFKNEKDKKLYKKQQVLQSEIETFEHLVATSDETERSVHEKSLAGLRHDLENTIIDMQLQNPQLASMVSVPPVDAEILIGLMEPGTALLSYYLLDNEVFCWILQANGNSAEKSIPLIRIPVNRGLLEKRILEYRRIIQNLEPYEKHATELYQILFKPVEKYLSGVHTIGISPHRSLHYLSFATLYDKNSFIVDRFALFYVPSAAVLEYTLNRRMERPYRSPRVLAIGNPNLGDPILDLPFAEQEVGSIKWNFPEITILTRDQVKETWVVENISDFDIIHIASHGEFDPVNPLLSAIKLSKPTGKMFTKTDSDGNLDAGEIFGLQMNADMVFLSACQTGLGKISVGDDVVGLNRSFFFAGTHMVISSLWRVSDVSTAIMTKKFYRSYMNRNKADCLKQAAIHVKMRYPHPGYWGAFTLVGDYY